MPVTIKPSSGAGSVTLEAQTGISSNFTLTLPGVSGTILTTGTTITVPQGGTGLTSLTAGRIPYGAGTSAFGSTSLFQYSNSVLNVGVTPAAWSGMSAVQVAGGGAFVSSSSYARFGTNFFFDGSYKYTSSMQAARYEQAEGAHVWYSAPSGTAGSAISFTQPMTLDASGQLTVGSASSSGLPITAFKLMASNNDATTGIGIVRFGTTYGSNLYHTYSTTLDAGAEAFGITVCETTALTDKTRTKYLVNQNGIHAWYGPTTSTERMRIDSSGNLLVGTTSASSGFKSVQVRGDTTNRGAFVMSCASANTTGVVGTLEAFNASTRASSIDFDVSGGSTSGRILTYTNNAGSYTLGPYLASGGTSWTSSSDERLKDITGSITDALSKISTLRTVYFNWKVDATKKRHVGLIAQDVHAVLPEAVDTTDRDRYGVVYTDMVPLLTAAIKELAAEVASLKEQLNA